MSLPAWTSWAKSGSEHDFRWRRAPSSATGTLYVDGQPFIPRELVLDERDERIDVTSYGDHGKSFLRAVGKTLSVGFAEGGAVVQVLGEVKTRRHADTDISEASFRGRVGEVEIDSGLAVQVAAQGTPAHARAMRDSPPSEDGFIPCEGCGDPFPPAEMQYCADPYAAEILGDESENWYCEPCLHESRMSI